MFEQSILAGSAKTRRAWTVPLGFAGELAALGLVALAPLVFFDGLPEGRLTAPVLSVPGAYRPPEQRRSVVRLVRTSDGSDVRGLVQPARVPDRIQLGSERPAGPPDLVPACTGVCVPGGVDPPTAVLTQRMAPPVVLDQRPPEPLRTVVRAVPVAAPIKVGGTVQEARLIHRVLPVYPRPACQIRIQGSVHLAAIIGADGRIRELQVLSGHPLLVPAAVDAVRQWAYEPTLLNGTPVEVMTDITVTFSLNPR